MGLDGLIIGQANLFYAFLSRLLLLIDQTWLLFILNWVTTKAVRRVIYVHLHTWRATWSTTTQTVLPVYPISAADLKHVWPNNERQQEREYIHACDVHFKTYEMDLNHRMRIKTHCFPLSKILRYSLCFVEKCTRTLTGKEMFWSRFSFSHPTETYSQHVNRTHMTTIITYEIESYEIYLYNFEL